MSGRLYERMEHAGNAFVDYYHLVGLFIIGGVVVWATAEELIHIVRESGPSIKDILLISIAILVLSLSVLVIRVGADRFPTRDRY